MQVSTLDVQLDVLLNSSELGLNTMRLQSDLFFIIPKFKIFLKILTVILSFHYHPRQSACLLAPPPPSRACQHLSINL